MAARASTIVVIFVIIIVAFYWLVLSLALVFDAYSSAWFSMNAPLSGWVEIDVDEMGPEGSSHLDRVLCVSAINGLVFGILAGGLVQWVMRLRRPRSAKGMPRA